MLTQERDFHVIPAVDILGDEGVRLERGDFRRVTHRESDPFALVERVVTAGARLVHLADLTAARAGRIRPELVARIVAAASPARVQAAGGIRSLADAERLLEAGATRVVIGTAAFAEDGALALYASAFQDQLVVAVDVRSGMVAVDGWERATSLTAEDAVQHCSDAGVRRLLCTAIERDGTLEGPDVELLTRVCALSGVPVVAAGGIRSPADLAEVEAAGCEGAIVGRALLDGALPLSVFAQ